MFIGHYGAAFAAKAIWPEAPLPALMLSTQIMDIAFCGLVAAGIEKIEITKEANATVPIRSISIPYSHGLESAVIYSVICAMGAALFYGDISSTALWVIALVCFSHWLIDAIVHPGDLPVAFNRFQVGLGLWNHRTLAIGLELAVIVGGIILLANSGAIIAWKVWVVGAGMIALQIYTYVAEPPPNMARLLVPMMAVFIVMIAIGWWMEAP